jgi:hypothetical protein
VKRFIPFQTLICSVLYFLWAEGSAVAASLNDRNENKAYALSTFKIPEHLKLEVSGLAPLPDGRLGIAIRKGEIWIADQTQNPDSAVYTPFATGLHEPLGLAFHKGAFYTVQRTELTRISDLDADGVADEYWTIAKGWGVTGNYHEYAYGPQFDYQGNAWITLNIGIGKGPNPEDNAWRGWSIKVAPDGSWLPISAGFRSPSGIGMNPAGDIFATDQQGNWFPTCPLVHIKPGTFHGHIDALEHTKRPKSSFQWEKNIPKELSVVEAAKVIPPYKLPAIWFPYRTMGMSATDVLWNSTQGKFGPFEGQAFVGEFTMSMLLRVYLEEIDGVYQGACFRFFEGLQCGVLRLAWDEDGSLIIGESNRGWNSLGNRSYGMQKLNWTGVTPFEMQRINALPNGFRITLTQPILEDPPIHPEQFRIRSYTYHYHANYGSEKIDEAKLDVHHFTIAKDRKSITVQVKGLREGYVHEIELTGIKSTTGDPLLHPVAAYTLNKIPKKRD